MITKQAYAAIAAAVYKNVRSDRNEPLLPAGWFRVPLPDTLLGSLLNFGFSGAIYVNDATREVAQIIGDRPRLFPAKVALHLDGAHSQ